MSAGEPLRPRRGWQPDEDPDDPVVSDDTPEPAPSPARRGALADPPEDADGGADAPRGDAPQDDVAEPTAVAIVVRGHSVLAATPSARNSSAKPSVARVIAYFASM